jgi:DNA recombination protein RmuC
MDTFPLVLTLAAVLAVGLALGAVIGVLWARSRPADDTAIAALQQRVADHAVVQDGLERLQDQLSDLAHDRTAWQAQLHQQVADVRRSTDVLRHETHTLATALRKPQVRGQWGELHLRRTVELAGLVDHCDFAEQTRLDDGRLRPDLVVTLAGGRTIAVDAKAPLAAFLDLTGADDPAEHERALARLGEHVRKHVADLGSRRYWEALAGTPEFVVLFLPGEAILQAALQAVPDLVAQAHEVQRLGQELHARLGSMAGHLDKVGRSLNASVVAYNQAVGSLEGRVLVSARRFADLGVTNDQLEGPRQVETVPRSAAAPELGVLDDVPGATGDPTLEDLLDQPPGTAPPAARRARGA